MFTRPYCTHCCKMWYLYEEYYQKTGIKGEEYYQKTGIKGGKDLREW